jgi:hypothetical protein
MPPIIVRPKEKNEDPNDYSERNSTPRRPELTVLNLDVNPLKIETISIKGHEYHSAQSSYQSHDLTYQSFCKTHVSHDNNALSSIAETNSRGLDAFSAIDSVAPSDRRSCLTTPSPSLRLRRCTRRSYCWPAVAAACYVALLDAGLQLSISSVQPSAIKDSDAVATQRGGRKGKLN